MSSENSYPTDTWREFVRAQGVDPDTLHPCEREVGAMIDRVGVHGWGPRDRRREIDIELNPRKLADHAKRRTEKAAREGRGTWPGWSAQTYRRSLANWVTRGWILPTSRRRNTPQRYRPAWWKAAGRRVEGSWNADWNAAKPRIQCPGSGLGRVLTQTGLPILPDRLTDGQQEKPGPQPERPPSTEKRLPPKGQVRLAECLGRVQEAYPSFAKTLRKRVDAHIRGGTPQEVVSHALLRVLEKRPDRPIGYYANIVEREEPNYREKQAMEESTRLKLKTGTQSRGSPLQAVGDSDLLSRIKEWGGAREEVNAALREARDDPRRHLELGACARNFDLERLRSLVREWSRTPVDSMAACEPTYVGVS